MVCIIGTEICPTMGTMGSVVGLLICEIGMLTARNPACRIDPRQKKMR